jgi:hypothetical protein
VASAPIQENSLLKLFGYPDSEQEQTPSGPSTVSEVTICASPAELRKISSFLAACADEMERMGPSYDHVHLGDRMKEFASSPELIVARASS